jgi:Ca2+-binding RTX toxin-like protein
VSTGNDAIDGGAGIDTVNYAEGGGRTEGVNVNLATGVGGTISGGEIDALINVENVFGTRFDDTLIGDGGDNILAGQLGNDLLDGGGGSDTVSFNEEYAPARTTVNNIVSPRTEGVNVNLSTGVGGTISGGETDALISIENVIGTNFGDTITGDNNTNVLDGGGGADTLEGGAGDDAFAFSAGESNGDIIVDFAGNGASVGDVIAFHGYGTAAEGATFVQIDATHWQINSADGLVHDVITLANGATVDASDYIFGP